MLNIPHFYASFAARIDILGRIANSNCADDFTVAQRIQLSRVSWNARSTERIGWKWYWLHLTFGHDEGICSKRGGKNMLKVSVA